MVLVLGLVLLLIYVTLNWGLRRLLKIHPAQQAAVKVHERVALDAKRAVFLVEAAGEFLLLGAGEREVAFLAKLDAEQARAALARKAERPTLPSLSGKPFWERLLVKPPARGEAKKDDPGAPGGTQAS